MKNQLITTKPWQPMNVATAFVVRAYGFDMRAVCNRSSLVTTTTNKHHAAAGKATAQGLPPWSPPVT